jgi:hypothetical protein
MNNRIEITRSEVRCDTNFSISDKRIFAVYSVVVFYADEKLHYRLRRFPIRSSSLVKVKGGAARSIP